MTRKRFIKLHMSQLMFDRNMANTLSDMVVESGKSYRIAWNITKQRSIRRDKVDEGRTGKPVRYDT